MVQRKSINQQQSQTGNNIQTDEGKESIDINQSTAIKHTHNQSDEGKESIGNNQSTAINQMEEAIITQQRADDKQALFNSFGLQFNVDTYMRCVQNDITLDEMLESRPAYTFTLLKLASSKDDDDHIKTIVSRWLKAGYSIQMLHAKLIILASDNGFFTQMEDAEELKLLANDSLAKFQLVIPGVLKGYQGFNDFLAQNE